jgi:hypothetical protein
MMMSRSCNVAAVFPDHVVDVKLADWFSESSLWVPNRIVPSAWLEHAQFCFWLVGATRPRTFVELGTHRGFSYLAFCQAVQQHGIGTTCCAIDTWKGDEHTGFYGEEVFSEVQAYHNRLYSGFSQLIRSRFYDAVNYFADESIDLLHIDGRHFYIDVKTDFETWAPKLSDRAIVLFHDINVREKGFGVWRFWEELISRYPSFAFQHGSGLGVLAFGLQIPKRAQPLFLASSETVHQIRQTYARLGSAVSAIAERDALKVELPRLQAQVAELELVRRQLSAMEVSTSWRMTYPLRRLMQGTLFVRNTTIELVKLAWRTGTGLLYFGRTRPKAAPASTAPARSLAIERQEKMGAQQTPQRPRTPMLRKPLRRPSLSSPKNGAEARILTEGEAQSRAGMLVPGMPSLSRSRTDFLCSAASLAKD